jgi:hypothetical protein
LKYQFLWFHCFHRHHALPHLNSKNAKIVHK